VRRERLERAPRQDFERRILVGLEHVLERLGWGLRTRSDRLRPQEASGFEATFEADTAELPAEAEIVGPEVLAPPPLKRRVSSRAPKRENAKKGAKPRIRVSTLTPAQRPASNENHEKTRTKPPRQADKGGRVSTRWVSPPKVDLDALTSLSARELIAKIPSLDHETCRALLLREKANKKRKTVMEALSARLPS
jgi:hypothetical protein